MGRRTTWCGHRDVGQQEVQRKAVDHFAPFLPQNIHMLRHSVLRTVRRTRSMDWLALAGKVSTDGARADVARLRDLVGEIQAEHQKFSGSPAPIDFDAYRSSINTPGLVDQFEAAYNSLSFPTYANESAASALADFDAVLATAESATSASAARLAVLEGMITSAETTKTSADTTVEEVLARHPEIGEEIDEEIKKHEWWKDV